MQLVRINMEPRKELLETLPLVLELSPLEATKSRFDSGLSWAVSVVKLSCGFGINVGALLILSNNAEGASDEYFPFFPPLPLPPLPDDDGDDDGDDDVDGTRDGEEDVEGSSLGCREGESNTSVVCLKGTDEGSLDIEGYSDFNLNGEADGISENKEEGSVDETKDGFTDFTTLGLNEELLLGLAE